MQGYTKKELASVAGYTYRRLYDIDMALPEGEKLFVKGEDGKYDLALFVQRWVEYNVIKEKNGGSPSLDDVRAIHEQIKTKKTEMEVAKMRGELVEIEAVRRLWGDIANHVTQGMLRLPGKIAPQIVMIDNVEIISGIIDQEVRSVLSAIAQTPVPEGAAKEEREEEEE